MKKIITTLSLILLIVLCLSGCGESDTANTSSGLSDSSSQASSNSISLLELLEELQNNADMPFSMNDNAKKMLTENEALFIGNEHDNLDEYTDYSVEYRMLTKNIDKYGDKLIYIPEAYVISISETPVDNKTFTEMQLLDADENSYEVFSEASYDDIFEDDVVTCYGLPLGETSFDNISGGTTLAIVLAGSSVEKLQ